MQKFVWSLFVLVVIGASSAFATPVPPDRLGDYKEAVLMAVNVDSLKCVSVQGDIYYNGGARALIQDAQALDVSTNQVQPLLTFVVTVGKAQFKSMVTTSADLRAVVKMRFEQASEQLIKINEGTLENPRIVTRTEMIVGGIVDCNP